MRGDAGHHAQGGVIGYFTRHGTAANLLLVILVVLGLAAMPNMRAQFFPDVVRDEVRVSIEWENAGPEEIDRAVVGPVMPALQAVDGVDEISSRANNNSAYFVLEFEPGWNMDRALDEVQTALDDVSDLPEEAEEPRAWRHAWNDRVTDVVISGPVGVDQLARFADDYILKLFDAGVTRTEIKGIADPQTVVRVPTIELIRHDLTLSEIASAIGAEAESDPAGDIDAANARLRSGTGRRSAADIAAIALRSYDDGSTLSVGDIADIEVGGVDRVRAFFVGADPAISIEVDRSAAGDALEIQDQVAEVAAEMAASLPPGMRIDLTRTRSELIKARLQILIENGLMGLGLVLALLFLFLSARTAFWVAMGLPVSMLAAVAIMFAMGVTFNMISLFGLILTLGIVVDDAIVVGEHADHRVRVLGEPAAVAAERAARRMALPVFSATLTTIIAFWGLAFIGGRFGQLIRDIPITVIAVLAASLIECLLILPNHMAHSLSRGARNAWFDWPSRQFNRVFRWFRERIFRRVIGLVLTARYPVLAGAVLILATQAAFYISGTVPWQFFNSPERGTINGNFAMLPLADREDTLAQMRELQRAVAAVGARLEAEHGLDPVDYAVAGIGGNVGRGLPGADIKDPDLLGSVTVELIDADLRPYSSYAFIEALQEETLQMPLTETISYRGWWGEEDSAIDVELSGAESLRLKEAAEALKRRLEGYPEVTGLQDSMSYDKREVILDLTPQGRLLGFTIDDLGQTLRHRLNGIEAANFPVGPRTGTIRVELPEDEQSADFLQRMLVKTANGDHVPLADLVTVSAEPGFSVIRRENGRRVISVTGELSEDDPVRAAEIMETLEQVILPELASEYQVEWDLSGLAEEESEFLTEAAIGFTLCLLGIFVTLAWIFASWSRPLAIMAIIPFGFVGAIWGHYVWEIPMSMFSIVGLIGMSGIIINDSIVLISAVDDYARDRGLRPAILDAVCDRLRPVLLTTLTTVLGLCPLLYESSQQAQFLKPTVVTLVYGLSFGMLLVLLVVPALLLAGQDIAQSFRAGRRALSVSSRGRITHGAALALALLLALWFAVTLGGEIVTGATPLAALFPELPAGWEGRPLAFAAFAAGAVLLTLLVYLAAALAAIRSRNRRAAP